MISRFIISAIACLLVLCSQVYSASIEFTEELVYTIPGIDKVDEAFFNDVDFDGVPEILARRTNHIVAYSLTGDSVFFETDTDTATYRKFLFADINRDSVTDIAVACFHNYNGHSDSALMIAVYDGADNYNLSRQYYPNTESLGDLWLVYSAALSLFTALDINQDGYNELLLSYCNWIWNGGAGPPAQMWTEYQYPISRLYFSYPDSLIWQIKRQLGTPVMTGPPENRFFMANDLVKYNYDYGTEMYIQNTSIFRLDTNLLDYYIIHDTIMDYSAAKQGCVYIYKDDKQMLNCAGDFMPAGDGVEFISTYNYKWDCVDPMDPFNVAEVLIMNLRAYRMPEPDSAELIWWKDYINYKNYVYLPDNPGFFFAFLGDLFVQIDGATGNEVFSTPNIPSGSRHWDYPFADGRPYLITFDTNIVTIYQANVMTDIDREEDNPPMPTIFGIGQPYPNPFNASQTIPVTVKPGQILTVDVYNLLGQKIDCIYSGVAYTQQLNLTWKADKFASGIYFIMATSDDATVIKKSILLK